MKLFLKYSKFIILTLLSMIYFCAGYIVVFYGMVYFFFLDAKQNWVKEVSLIKSDYFWIPMSSLIIAGMVCIYHQTSKYINFQNKERDKKILTKAANDYCRSIQEKGLIDSNGNKREIDLEFQKQIYGMVASAFINGSNYQKENN